MLVLAGPGSGKTTVITNRVRYLTEKAGVDPSHILVITFTRAAAREMKERYEQIAQAGADVIIGGHPHRLQALPLWVMFQLHIVLEISGFPPEHCIQHCQKLPLQRMEQ